MKKKVLIIEDEESLAKSLALVLKGDFEVFVAATGREGIEQAEKRQPDLIFLDVMLPDKQGPEILAALKRDKKTAAIPVVVLTNLDNPETVSKILAAGGKEYLVKTDWSVDEVAAKAREILG